MSDLSPLAPAPALIIGPLAISQTITTTWAIMAALSLTAWLLTRRLRDRPGRLQTLLEYGVQALEEQFEAAVQAPPRPFLPLLGTLFLFIVTANLSAVVPGVHAPTARLETTAALALVVFASVHVFGLWRRGIRAHFARYLKPTPLLLPLNILAELTRTLSLMIRLFGNIMSHELIVAVLLLLAGLLVPVPLMLLSVLIGIIQAYIFTILAAVFIGAAVNANGGH